MPYDPYSNWPIRLWTFTIVLVLGVARSSGSSAQVAPELSISIQEAASPIPSIVTPVYYGDADTLYAFLLVSNIEGHSASAVVVRWRIENSDGIEDLGFFPASMWHWGDMTHAGFDSLSQSGESGAVVPLGYWMLGLQANSGSHGVLRLVDAAGVDGSTPFVVDEEGREFPVSILNHAAINTSAPPPTAVEAVDPDLSNPSHHVLIRVREGMMSLPPGVAGAPLGNVTAIDSTLAATLVPFEPLRVDKVFPQVMPDDSLREIPGGRHVRRPRLWNVYRVTATDSSSIPTLLSHLANHPAIVYAEPNQRMNAYSTPNDPEFLLNNQWGLRNVDEHGWPTGRDIGADAAWEWTTGSVSVILGVVDTGIERGMADMAGRSVMGDIGYGCANCGIPYHGTEVAGVAAAWTDNGVALAGVDWRCKLYNGWSYEFSTSDLASKIQATAAAGADVINMSWGGSDSHVQHEAIIDACLAGCALIAASGSSNDETPHYPAAYTNLVTAVGAVDPDDNRWYDGATGQGSSYGPWLDLVAPGALIYVLNWNPPYWTPGISGTSLAAPYVSGSATLLKAKNMQLGGADIQEILNRTAHDIQSQGFDVETGWGRVRADAALEYVATHTFQEVVASPLSPVAVDNMEWVYWENPPNGNPGLYWTTRHVLERWVDFSQPHLGAADAWVIPAHTQGYPHSAPVATAIEPWAELASVDNCGCTVRTSVFEVQPPAGEPTYWWPCTPEDAFVGLTVAYPILGACCHEDGSCAVVSGPACLPPSTWQGNLVPCDPCPAPVEAWQGMAPGLNDVVCALFPDGANLWAGGCFDHSGESAVGRVARWDGSSWHAAGSGVNGCVYCLCKYNGRLIAAGGFTVAGDAPASRIAAWDGTTWSPLGEGLDDWVTTVAVYQGGLIAAGTFTHAGMTPASRIARWNGSSWAPIADDIDGTIWALTVYANQLIVGGEFSHVGAVAANHVAAWNGASWTALGTGTYGDVYSLLVDGTGKLIAGGNFVHAGSVEANRIASWNGASWASLGRGLNGDVLSLIAMGQSVVAGGRFAEAGGNPSSHIAYWDGSIWHSPGSGADDEVLATAMLGGTLRVGGRFMSVGGMAASHVVGWNSAGLGACCDPYGTCTMTAESMCTPPHVWSGGPTCTPNPCQAPVAVDFAMGPDRPVLLLTPNPVLGDLTITYRVATQTSVAIDVFNLLGARVWSTSRQDVPAGSHVEKWDGRDNAGNPLTSGIYPVRLRTSEGNAVGKVLLLRN